MNLGNAIMMLRKEQKISRVKLAERSNLSITALYNIENNLSFPSKETIDRLCASLEIPVSYLMFYSITEEDVPEEKRESFRFLQEPMKKFLMEK
ncbi:MAG: helix-turn-helix transcriptional regulator [Bacteroidaceae bacterium]|nr:helix-turn-helix transcriptional regulator [Bacteroidaceae bacterium]